MLLLKNKKLFLILIVVIGLMCSTNVAQAQEIQPMNLTLSPISIRLEASPGEQVSSKIKIRNNGTNSEKLKISLGTFQADTNGERPILLEPTEKDQFLTWLKFNENELEIFPGEWKEIEFTIDIPTEASLSYYYLIYVTQSNFSLKQGETNVAGAPAISVLLDVKSPNTVKELKLQQLKTQDVFVESLPKEFEIEVSNTGNTHIAPFGNLFIDGQGKKDLAVLPINPKDNVILPNSNRTYKIVWDDGFPIKGNGFLGFDWDLSKTDRFRLGKYTATVLLAYDNGERDIALETSLDFWVIPWKLILIAILITLLALTGLWSILKKPLNNLIHILKARLQKPKPDLEQ